MSQPTPNLAPLEAGTRALVLGLGRTGLSCARYLHGKGLAVRVADTRAEPPGSAALREQVPRAGKARAPETGNHCVTGAGGDRAHRSFSVARPASTSSRERIQKRTMTLGSAQPLSSK